MIYLKTYSVHFFSYFRYVITFGLLYDVCMTNFKATHCRYLLTKIYLFKLTLIWNDLILHTQSCDCRQTDKLCDDYVQVEIRKAPSSLMAYYKRSMSSHHRHGRTSKSSSLNSKPHKHKKKKRRWHYSEDDDEEDDSKDNDYVV